MADTPREAVEFARILTRAFHPPEFGVAVDAVLRGNNYCGHNELSHRLKLPPKLLRVTMVKLANAGLLKLEKREQVRISSATGRKRTVQSDFWYVPLRNVLEAFLYRVHRMSNELDAIILNAAEAANYICERCSAVFSALDATSRANDDGLFICDLGGVTNARRPSICGGKIIPQDTSGTIIETEALKWRFEHQLKPLRKLAEECVKLSIPPHPLSGADGDTWGAFVPDYVNANGEAVNEDGTTPDVSVQSKIEEGANITEDSNHVDHGAPAWFEDAGAADSDQRESDEEESSGLQVTHGTAAAYEFIDSKLYYEAFLNKGRNDD